MTGIVETFLRQYSWVKQPCEVGFRRQGQPLQFRAKNPHSHIIILNPSLWCSSPSLYSDYYTPSYYAIIPLFWCPPLMWCVTSLFVSSGWGRWKQWEKIGQRCFVALVSTENWRVGNPSFTSTFMLEIWDDTTPMCHDCNVNKIYFSFTLTILYWLQQLCNFEKSATSNTKQLFMFTNI